MKWLALCIGSFLSISLYMLKEAHENNVRTHQVRTKGKADQFKLFFISDVHNRKISQRMIEKLPAVEAVIIGGDFVDRRVPFSQVERNLALLSKLGPIYFVWGNNDREVGEKALYEVFAKYNVTVVENDAVQLPNRNNTTWISAINDTSRKGYSFPQALAKCSAEDVTIVVSHNPQVFYKAVDILQPALLMGGHLHGGQIRLGPFGVHPHGSFSIRQGVPTLISNGYGTTLLPLRFMAKPECHVVEVTVG